MPSEQKIIPVNIEEEMKTAYIDYSMSVIVSRAIPDARDGLKPVQRRILYGMNELGLQHNKPYKKSARIVGEVLGKYHPHGDSAVYEAMVRMAQWWSLRYELVDGQGNYGSIDDDPPAAMRYTEARLKKISEELLADIDKETVDFQLNFDDTLQEPTVLPSRIPNLLVNGASGIAVGMATNILPHNLSEVCDGIAAFIENRNISDEELVKIIPAPDFPTGGIIYGYEPVKQGMLTGKGRVVVRATVMRERLKNDRERFIITEIPYQVNKAELHKQIVQLSAEKIIEGISEARDESSREGVRLVIELKKDANADVVLNQLFKHTNLQASYSINNIALVNGRPRLLSLRQMIEVFVDFRHQVLVRKTQYELKEAEKRAHILEGLLIALDNLDEVIALIRAANSPDTARQGLMDRFALSEVQAKAILDMRLQRLTGLERDKIRNEYKEVCRLIEYYRDVLADEKLRMEILKDDILKIKQDYGDKRRTRIELVAEAFEDEDLIADDEMVITVSHLGYVKRTPITNYRRQGRGGQGAMASAARDEDFIEHIFIASNHNYLLFFTEKGRCYWQKVHQLPEGAKNVKGKAIRNIINLPADDSVRAIINIKSLNDEQLINSNYLIFCTRKGIIKKTTLEEFSRPRSSGIIAMSFKEGDQLLDVCLTNGNCDVLIAVRSGKAIRFHEDKVRPMGRTAAGVRGIDVEEGDEVVGMVCVNRDDKNRTILVVSEKGYGKRTPVSQYRITNRGAKGVKTINITPRTGTLVAIKDVSNRDDLMIIRKSGVAIRMSVADIPIVGRNTQGVRLIRLDGQDDIADIARIDHDDSDHQSSGNGPQQGEIFSKN